MQHSDIQRIDTSTLVFLKNLCACARERLYQDGLNVGALAEIIEYVWRLIESSYVFILSQIAQITLRKHCSSKLLETMLYLSV